MACAPAIVIASSTPTMASVRTIDTAVTAFRDTRSAIWPAGRASSGNGTNSASPTSPRSSGLRWTAYTCHPIATAIICDATPFAREDVHSRAKSRSCNAGGSRLRTGPG